MHTYLFMYVCIYVLYIYICLYIYIFMYVYIRVCISRITIHVISYKGGNILPFTKWDAPPGGQ